MIIELMNYRKVQANALFHFLILLFLNINFNLAHAKIRLPLRRKINFSIVMVRAQLPIMF